MSRLVVAIGHVEFTIAGQTLYVVKVQQDADEWEVRRTYSDFRKLREDVARVMRENRTIDACSQEFASAANGLAFPAKKLFGSKRDRVVRERAVELHQFLIRLLLLTHTYRKAQKQLYDPSSSSSQNNNTSASAHFVPPQQQASANVFYLLRDFLKPLGAKNGGISQTLEDENDESARRMIRESKMLSMRSSSHYNQQSAAGVPKTMSAPNVLAHGNNDTSASAQTQVQAPTSDQYQQQQAFAHAKANAALYRKQSTIPILEEAPPPGPSISTSSSKKTLNIAALMSRSARTDSNTSDRSNPLVASSATDDGCRSRNVSNASVASHYSTASNASTDGQQQPPVATLSSVQQGRKVSSASTSSASSYIGGTAAPVAIASSNVSSSSSAVYVHGSAPSSTSSSGAASRAYPPSNSSNTSSPQSQSQQQLAFYGSDDLVPSNKKNLSSSAHTVERRSKHHTNSSSSTNKKSGLSSSTSSATRSKMRSSSARDLRTSERKSKLSPQLTAQAVTINAQKELERYLSEYSAIMILRYVDRFISKAVTKAPGCYTVNAHTHRLVIDSERFLEELEDTFKDLPANFEGNFRNPYANGDWFFPAALDAYVQMKWNSFLGSSAPSSSSKVASKSKSVKSSGRGRRGSDSEDDSEDSDSEYETIGGGGGYMKAKKIFTDEEADVLDKMIADGTAGRDQMLRLRRQMNEVGWNRRAHPSGSSSTLNASSTFSSASSKPRKKKTEYWTDTDDDETRQTGSSGGEDQATVEHYQQKYNALRKERLSRRAEGGLV